MRMRILADNVTRSALGAEWGFSAYIEYEGRRLLYDTGAGELFAQNAAACGVDIAAVEYAVLSHAHYDHAGGLPAFFARNRNAKCWLRSACAENCYSIQPGSPARYIGIREGSLQAYRERLAYVSGQYELFPGAVLVPHTTPGLARLGRRAGMYVRRGDTFCPDCFDHEQSLVLRAPQGLVILNGCSHGGAANVIREAAAAFPGEALCALVGGLHLFRSTDEEIRALAEEIRAAGIREIYTGHCTGEHALQLLQQLLGPMVHGIFTGMEIETGG